MVIPYLGISDEQSMLAIEEDPKEFVRAQDDICGEQKSGTPKCAVAILLSDLVENVDGFLQFVFNFVIDAVVRCSQGESTLIEDGNLQTVI